MSKDDDKKKALRGYAASFEQETEAKTLYSFPSASKCGLCKVELQALGFDVSYPPSDEVEALQPMRGRRYFFWIAK